MRNKLLPQLLAVAVVFGACASALTSTRAQGGSSHAPVNASRAQEGGRVMHKTIKIDGLDIFYREAGSRANPTVLLLHGFPTSSQMFRNLMPRLAGRYHVIAPDYPGYGNSSAPPVDKYDYTFDNFANVVDKFAQALKLERYSLYVMDYGAPVGYRLAVRHPERVQALIVQKGNAYEEGLREFWIPFRAYWKERSEQNAEPLRKLLIYDATKWQYTNGVRNVEMLSPDTWTTDAPGSPSPSSLRHCDRKVDNDSGEDLLRSDDESQS
ncbi:MAG TPA: alpha/beta fold hydrolase [Pyrinomonadaceae bacterium]